MTTILQRHHANGVGFTTVQVSEGAAGGGRCAVVRVPITGSRRGNIGISPCSWQPGGYGHIALTLQVHREVGGSTRTCREREEEVLYVQSDSNFTNTYYRSKPHLNSGILSYYLKLGNLIEDDHRLICLICREPATCAHPKHKTGIKVMLEMN